VTFLTLQLVGVGKSVNKSVNKDQPGGFFLDFFSQRSLDQPQALQRKVGWIRSPRFVGQAYRTLDN
jgi:hypothetical protein